VVGNESRDCLPRSITIHPVVHLSIGLLLLILASALAVFFYALFTRRSAGFGRGPTRSSDSLILVSTHYHLSGRPDRIVQVGAAYIPEEKKSGTRLYQSYRLQLGVYLLLVEEHYGVRPPYGVVVLGDGQRVQIDNTPALRQQVVRIAEQIRQHRALLTQPLRPTATPAKCRVCSQRVHCHQRLA
jgi:CRISPR-associated exonuclease Cas4